MIVTSQNGWPAYATTDHFVRATARGLPFWAANDDVAVVFCEFITRFDTEVEPIAGPVRDDWSYANRLVRGSQTEVSNHGSATAIDLNALQHPRGKHNTFTKTKAARVRRIKNEITDDDGEPVLRLGMDYSTTVDDMHVEINADAERVKQAADKLRAQEAGMALSQTDVDRIAEAVGQLIIPNKNPTGPDGKSTVAGSIVDIERTQDIDRETAAKRHAEIMAAIAGLASRFPTSG